MTEAAKKPKTKPKRGLDHALLEAQQTIHSIGKDSTNAHHKYEYTSAEHMIAETRPVLIDCGILVRVGKTWQEELPSGLLKACAMIHGAHPSSGEKCEEPRELPACSGKGRPEDKAVLASNTTILNYYLRGLLLIPRVDEEVCARDDTKHEAAAQKIATATKKAATKVDPVPKPANPVTDATFQRLTDFIRSEADGAKSGGKEAMNNVILHLKQELVKATKVVLPPGTGVEKIVVSDLRPQLSEEAVYDFIMEQTIPF